MIKLAALALLPLVAATVYVPSELQLPTARVEPAPTASESEIRDREFLTVLEVQSRAAARTARADREFLASLQVQEMPVMKAIPVQRSETAPPADVAISPGTPEVVPEVRKAIPVTRTQPDLRQSFLTMPDPEVRRAVPVATLPANRERASITIIGDQVIVRPKLQNLSRDTARPTSEL